MIRVVPRREKAAQRDPINRRPDFFAQPRLEYQIERVLLIDRCRVRSRAMAARYRKGLELQALGRDLARLERICRTAETDATIKCVMLRLIACRRRCRVIRPCAMDIQDGAGRFRRLRATCAAGKASRYTRIVSYTTATTNSVRNAVRCPLRDAVAYMLLRQRR
jgi:hypothetical protein